MTYRQPHAAAEVHYDAIIVGGGIYGMALSLMAAQRGHSTLLLERNDFGGATSAASLRIIHGGLRYLQMLDLVRHRESVAERRWFLKYFPDLVKPLVCLMPLYRRGLRRRSLFRLALAMDDALSRRRNDGVAPSHQLPSGRVLGPEETALLFPLVDRRGLEGGGLWYDAAMVSSERLLIEMLRWARAGGATHLNYIDATETIIEQGRVCGVNAVDRLDQTELTFRASKVINATGASCRDFAIKADRDLPYLFEPSLAFNVLFDHMPLADVAVAVYPNRPGARTYFLLPWRGRILAGTYHATWSGKRATPSVSREQLANFIEDLNSAVPGLRLTQADVLRVYAGLLPAACKGAEAAALREVIHDHGAHGGPPGLYSISGVKYTTARIVAEKALTCAFGNSMANDGDEPAVARPAPLIDLTPYSIGEPWTFHDLNSGSDLDRLNEIIRQEYVVFPEDLWERRLGLVDVDDGLEAAARRLCLSATATTLVPGKLESTTARESGPIG